MGRRDYKKLEGKYVQVKFWDHCYGSLEKLKEDMLCEVIGKLVEDSERSIVIGGWTQVTKELSGKDEDGYRILKSCIEKIKVLK